MTIWTNLKMSDADRALFIDRIGACRLIESTKGASSVLADSEPDETLFEADVALGQPDPDEVMKTSRLRWLQITTAGYTRYDTDAFRRSVREKGLVVCNSSAVYEDACTEHLLSFILAQARQLPAALNSAAEPGDRGWHTLRASCRLLKGQKALVIGYGAIAEKTVPVLLALGMEVTGARRSPRGNEAVPVLAIREVDDALASADHVINILPQSPDTDGYFDAGRLGRMKKGSVFYNIGRGSTVDQEALAQALKSGHLGAAWLDVSEPEPLPADHALRSLTNCHVTPHTAGGHEGEAGHVVRHFLENFRRFKAREALINRIM